HAAVRRACLYPPRRDRRSLEPAAQPADVLDPAARGIRSEPPPPTRRLVVSPPPPVGDGRGASRLHPAVLATVAGPASERRACAGGLARAAAVGASMSESRPPLFAWPGWKHLGEALVL